ncbi:MAG: M20/M25/M40 family metallo-hydrolase [Flavisolibacter sp.]|nr:M20/M25/M40 family metallo-hydrolase [Flavisolibacter sp.]
MKRVALCLLIILTTFYSIAQTDDSLFIRRMADEILLHSRAYENLRVLTKQIGGRLSGSPQMVKAELWGLSAMKDAGADTAWWQECVVPHWVRGGQDRAYATYGKNKKTLDVTALGNSAGSMKPLTAPVIEIKNFDDLEQKKDLVKGKIVFYNYPFNPTFIRTFQAYGDAVPYRGAGPSRAARYGAKAVIVRSMTHSVDNNPHTGATIYNDSFAKVPAVAIGLQHADWLSNQLKKENVVVTLHTNGHFLPDTISHNVIGEIRGTQFPNEYITVGGHLDSWDLAEGAHDDGAGCVQTIEILRTFKVLGYQPKHTLRFVLFTNEENGVRGGPKYAEEAKAKGEKHIFALESDAGGFTPRGFGFTVSPEQFEKIRKWQALLAPYGAYELNHSGGGADIGPLNTSQGTPVAGLQPDSQRYFDVHHSRGDVFEAVNKRELELGTVSMAALLYLVDKYGL